MQVERIKQEVEQTGAETGAEAERSTLSDIDIAANINAGIILRQSKRIGVQHRPLAVRNPCREGRGRRAVVRCG